MAQNKNLNSLLESFTHELRRGSVVLAVLSQLDEAQYGYSLITQMAEKGFQVDQGTLYPLLRRLEGQGLLESEWVVVENARPRRYYRISELGKQIFEALKSEWDEMHKVMEGVLK